MISVQDKQSFSDLCVILQMMPTNMQQMISTDFISFVEENKDDSYESNIDKNIPLREQELSESTKIYLALIYKEYLSSTSAKGSNYTDTQTNQANSDFKFDFSFNNTTNIEEKENTSLIETKNEIKPKGFFSKITNFIQNFLK